jgi:malate synthase
MTTDIPAGVTLHAPSEPPEHVLTPEALAFVRDLTRTFGGTLQQLLTRRVNRQAALRQGQTFDFLPETAAIRSGDWTVAPLPEDLLDRRVELTGPVDRKMVINALNSGAQTYMADFEDSTAPTFYNLVSGQRNLMDAVRRTISYEALETGKRYVLHERTATLLVRPRGLHLPELHLYVDGAPVPGAFFDFGLFFFHNARALCERGSGPYFYLPKLESHLEARLWNQIFLFAQERLGLPSGTIKATVLIETLPAAFEMHEILYELREHAAGLNCGRWDYIFSFIKKHAADARAVLPDRSEITMDKGFLRAYAQLLIQTCHRREAHAMGGMAAQIPIKGDAVKNEQAFAKVSADKLREVTDGHDGTWVAHPGLVALCREVFDAKMPGKNQLANKRTDVRISAEDLLAIPSGPRTEAGLRHNIRVGVQYVESWLCGLGCVPLYNLMEDAATAEIARAQVWQWLRHGATLRSAEGGDVPLTLDRLRTVITEELQQLGRELGEAKFRSGRFYEARVLFEQLATQPEFTEFLTLPAYEVLLATEAQS